MKRRKHRLFRPAVLLMVALGLAGCASTQTKEGVEIKKSRNYNPLNWF